ncbi:nodal homolog 3-A-like [Diadema antillarum]|uniref:nodal homolog 3-A-like n=1 Tax=Diadema antillarum TaxID=105358 RepID=UPI003A8B0881
MESLPVSILRGTLIVCFISSAHCFFAPFLHLPPRSWDDDHHGSASRARRNVITPSALVHSSYHELAVDQHHNSSSMFMMELFESLHTGHNLLDPSPAECRAIQSADTVRSFQGSIKGVNSTVKNVTRWMTSFPTFDQPADEAIYLAELRVQLNSTLSPRPNRGFIMQLHQRVNETCDHSGGGPCYRLLHSREILAHHDDFDGREVFDITDLVQQWVASAKDSTYPVEYNIEMRVKSIAHDDSDVDHEKDVLKALLAAENLENGVTDNIDLDFVVSPVTEFDLFEEVIKDVTMVVFSRANTKPILLRDSTNSLRVRRSTEEQRRRKKQKDLRKHQREQQRLLHEEKLRREQEMAGPCRRADMSVDFGRIGWDEWIIYPKKFNAFKCIGTCSGPLHSGDNPSNHAIMQDLIRLHQPERRTPEPCCVPTKLRPLSMLYFEEGSVLVRHHEDMIVEECGCR